METTEIFIGLCISHRTKASKKPSKRYRNQLTLPVVYVDTLLKINESEITIVLDDHLLCEASALPPPLSSQLDQLNTEKACRH